MPKGLPETSKIDHFGNIGSDFEIGGRFTRTNLLMKFDWPRIGPLNQKSKKGSTQGGREIPAGTKLVPRMGEGGGKPPPGSEG